METALEEPSPRNVRVSVLDSCPESYRTISPDELRLSAVVDSFQRQYVHLYPERKPLLLCPLNECGVKKFVCTTIRASPPAFSELFTWRGCAAFVADFLSVELLESPTEVPRHVSSPTSVLQTQRATCFESATLLCSLLLGAHYDAYCVSGYAVRRMCLLDQSLQDCPLLDMQVCEQREENESTVSPLKELKSHFLIQQEKKKQEAELLEQKLQEEPEQQPGDALPGLRVHCWLLVLSGSRSVQENFFIDPLTGNSYSTSDHNFLGIESVWNNLNYYVNMQDCSNGCADVRFDLEDVRMWEPLLFGTTSKKQLILDVVKKKEKTLIKARDKKEEDQEPRVFEMPRSWVDYITVTKKDLETRWPKGQKVTRYRKAKLERFSASDDGLVTRLTTYKDSDCSDVATVKEWFECRSDHLEQREFDTADGFTTDRFKHGRSFSLLVHRYLTSESRHDMDFSRTHTDNVMRRVVSSREMTETFQGRSDFLYYRHMVFGRHVQFSESADSVDPIGQIVEKVVERFHRNRSKAAKEDVAERVFLVAERRVEVTYHPEDHRLISSKRSFVMPRLYMKEKEEDIVAGSGFQVDPADKPPNILTLYHMLHALVKAENQVLCQISASITEVREIMACREQEQSELKLHFSWSMTAPAGVREQREQKEKHNKQVQESQAGVLAPHLIQLGYVDHLSATEAKQIYRACLAKFQKRLEEMANLIQERYEKEKLELQKKREWYKKNQLSLNDEQNKDYKTFCADKMLQIRVAKHRLRSHKNEADQKFKEFKQKLKLDHRLAPHLQS